MDNEMIALTDISEILERFPATSAAILAVIAIAVSILIGASSSKGTRKVKIGSGKYVEGDDHSLNR